MSRDAACNLERCIDSMWMLTTVLFGSRLQGQECKRETAAKASSRALAYTSAEFVHSILDLHCAQFISTYRQHKNHSDHRPQSPSSALASFLESPCPPDFPANPLGQWNELPGIPGGVVGNGVGILGGPNRQRQSLVFSEHRQLSLGQWNELPGIPGGVVGNWVGILGGPNRQRQSLVFSEHRQLSQAIPQFHVE